MEEEANNTEYREARKVKMWEKNQQRQIMPLGLKKPR